MKHRLDHHRRRLRIVGIGALVEVDAQAGVAVDRIGEDRVTGAGIHAHTRAAVVGNHIADRAADLVARRVVEEAHAIGPVAQAGVASGIGADEVALNDVPRTIVNHHSAAAAVTGNDVARSRRGAADGIVGRGSDAHAVVVVRQRRCTGHVGADVVAQHCIAR